MLRTNVVPLSETLALEAADTSLEGLPGVVLLSKKRS